MKNAKLIECTSLEKEFSLSDKNNWCKENNIPIIRIPYTYQEKITIEDLLLESSNFLLKG